MTRTYVFSRPLTCWLPRGGWHDAPSGGGGNQSVWLTKSSGEKGALSHTLGHGLKKSTALTGPPLRLLFAFDKTHLQYGGNA